MEKAALKRIIREVLSKVLVENAQPEYIIFYHFRQKEYDLYQRITEKDFQGDVIEKFNHVEELGADKTKAERKAYNITGQIVPVVIPQKKSEKPANRGELTIPLGPYQGKAFKDIPIEYLITFIFNRKWLSMIRRELYVQNMYEYLTKDVAEQTLSYLTQLVNNLDTPDLIKRYKNYRKTARTSVTSEAIAFEKMILPLLIAELNKRGIQTT